MNVLNQIIDRKYTPNTFVINIDRMIEKGYYIIRVLKGSQPQICKTSICYFDILSLLIFKSFFIGNMKAKYVYFSEKKLPTSTLKALGEKCPTVETTLKI